MALKFRRGTTAQKSGSLAFGEPFINTDLNTLQIGGASGDITLGTTGESSAFAGVSVSASSFISGSGLKITGNAAIDGNLTLGGAITIGDATADTVNVVASLSSSLIPSNDNAFDVGRNDKRYRAVYGNTLSASVLEIESGSTVEIRLKNSTTGIRYDIQNTNGGNLAIHNSNTGQSIIRIDSGSFPQQTNIFGNLNVSQSLSVGNEVQSATGSFGLLRTTDTISGSIQGIGNVSSYSSSVNSRLVVTEGVSASAASALSNVSGAFATTFANLDTNYATDAQLSSVSGAFVTTIANLGSTYATDSELSAVSSAVAVRDAAQDVLISSLQSNIVSASVFNTFSTSVDSRILTEKGRVDAILSASTADADTFAEIVTLINSVDTTSDAVFGGFVTSSNATNNTQNARLSALETETGSIATAQSAQNARLTSLETTSGSHNSRLSNLEGFSSSLNSTFATDSELSSVSGAFATSQASQDTLISSLRTNVVSASVFTTFSTSVDSRLDSVELVSASAAGALNNVSGAFATTIGNLGSTYATDAELSAVSSAVAVRDAGQDTTISTLSSSVNSRLVVVEGVSASAASALNSFSASNATINNTQTTNITTATQAAAGAFASASAYSASAAVVDAAQDVLIASLRTNVVSSSVFTTFSTSVDSRLDTVELLSASAATAYAKVGSENTFNGNQTITGSLFISQDLIVQGSSSIQNISSSTLNIGTNLITVNTLNPGTRFGGLAVIDSGSSPLISGSILFDSINDQWIFVHQIVSGAATTSSVFLMGPQTYNSLGSEVYPTTNRVVKSINSEHIGDSNITDNGTLITLGSNTSVTGTLVATGTSLVSASAQINITSTTGYSTFSSSVASTISNLGSTYATDAELSSVSGAIATRDAGQDTTISTLSSSVASRLGTLETKDITITLTGDVTGTGTITDLGSVSFATTVAANSVALGTDTTGDYVSSLVAGTNITLSNNSGEGATPTIGLTNNAITIAGTSTSLGGSITAATILGGTGVISGSAGLPAGLVSGSSQITASVFGAVSGDVTITAGGVASIGANSVALGTDTTGNYVASLVAGTNITLSNNSGEGATPTIGLTNNTISGISLGSNLATLTIGTGLSGTSYNGSTGVTIANTGVTSAVAGTGVSVSGATGAVTISIGQAVGTSDNVRFNSLGIGMAASATAGRIDATNDIVAFSSSDIRFKENIKPIENPIEKIRKISGNTYDWKEENKIEHGYEGNDVGVIAQEIEAVLPQLVQTRESGYKAVKYDKLVALLIEGIKEQQLQIEQLRIDLDNCRNKGL